MSERIIINDKEIDLIQVDSIREEKEFIKNQKCSFCNGDYKISMQTVNPEEKIDILIANCSGCHSVKEFYFDISSFFGINNMV